MNKSLLAKPVVADQYWIVTDGDNKIGNVVATPTGYVVKLNGQVDYCENTLDIMRDYSIQFDNKTMKQKKKVTYGSWPTTGKTYNNLLDIKRKLHLYTKSRDSKCYYAAGYYNIFTGSAWQTVLCPKYIFIQRYQWNGPYCSMEEADQHLQQNLINTA